MRFYDKVLTAIAEKNISKLDELFNLPEANPNETEFLFNEFGLGYGKNLISGAIKKLHNDNDDVIISYVKYLIKKGVMISIEALKTAIIYQKVKLVEFILKHNAELNTYAFPLVGESCNLVIAKLLIKRNMDPNCKSPDGSTALINAVKSSHDSKIEFITYLLSNNADISLSRDWEDINMNPMTLTAISEAYKRLFEAEESYQRSKFGNREYGDGFSIIDPFSIDRNFLEYSYWHPVENDEEHKEKIENARSLFHLLLEHAKEYVYRKTLQILRHNKINFSELKCKIREIIFQLAGKSSMGHLEKDLQKLRWLHKILLDSLFEPVMEMLKKQDSLKFSVYCGNHTRLGNDSSLSFLFKDKLYDPNLMSIVFDYVDCPDTHHLNQTTQASLNRSDSTNQSTIVVTRSPVASNQAHANSKSNFVSNNPVIDETLPSRVFTPGFFHKKMLIVLGAAALVGSVISKIKCSKIP